MRVRGLARVSLDGEGRARLPLEHSSLGPATVGRRRVGARVGSVDRNESAAALAAGPAAALAAACAARAARAEHRRREQRRRPVGVGREGLRLEVARRALFACGAKQLVPRQVARINAAECHVVTVGARVEAEP